MVKNATKILILALFVLFLLGCRASSPEKPREPALTAAQPAASPAKEPPSETPAQRKSDSAVDSKGFRIRPLEMEVREGRAYLPVGAEIVSKDAPVRLIEAIKRMAELHGFSVSWADDVDPETLVNVHIRPADNFWDALGNLLRQRDYFYEQVGDTILINYKETRRYTVPMPALKESFSTSVGGNLFEQEGSAIRGQTELKSVYREDLDFWSTLENNIRQIIDSVKSEDKGSFMIDQNIGTITVNAPLKTHKKLEDYMNHLKQEVYKQVVLQVKIVEVRLNDESSMGIDWSNIFIGSDRGTGTFGGDFHFGEDDYVLNDGSIATDVVYPTHKFLRYITMSSQSYQIAIDAMKEYGEINVLSTPKVSLLNGHGATLLVGERVTYIAKVTSNYDEAGNLTSQDPQQADILSGIGLSVIANVIDNSEVILYVVPVTSELQEPIQTATFTGTQIGLPRTRLRELATTCRIHDNETLIIGGHIDKVESEDTNRIPFLGDIPGLGWLFKHEAKSTVSRELVIFITPKIVAANE